MRKIVSLFKRNMATGLVTDEVMPDALWAAKGEGYATKKWDGTACLVRDGRLFKRYDAKHGKTPPAAFEPAQPNADPITGHWPGWLPVGEAPEDRWHREAWAAGRFLVWRGGAQLGAPTDGTYELCGPKIGGNREGLDGHYLVKHGGHLLDIDGERVPRVWDALRDWLAKHPEHEGVVWYRRPFCRASRGQDQAARLRAAVAGACPMTSILTADLPRAEQARRLGVTRQSVARRLRALGLPLRSRSDRRVPAAEEKWRFYLAGLDLPDARKARIAGLTVIGWRTWMRRRKASFGVDAAAGRSDHRVLFSSPRRRS